MLTTATMIHPLVAPAASRARGPIPTDEHMAIPTRGGTSVSEDQC